MPVKNTIRARYDRVMCGTYAASPNLILKHYYIKIKSGRYIFWNENVYSNRAHLVRPMQTSKKISHITRKHFTKLNT